MKARIALRQQLTAAVEALGVTSYALRESRHANPFPVGSRTVHEFIVADRITDSALWKLLVYFEDANIEIEIDKWENLYNEGYDCGYTDGEADGYNGGAAAAATDILNR